MKPTIIAALTATLGLLLIAFVSQPEGVWKLSPKDSGVPFFLQISEANGDLTGELWVSRAASAQAPLVLGKDAVARNGIQLTIDLPPNFSPAPGGELKATLGPSGNIVRARLAGVSDHRLNIKRTRHRSLEAVLAQSSRLQAEHLASTHLASLTDGPEAKRLHAATELGRGGREVIPFLLNAVAKSDGSWNRWAVTTLENMGPEAVDPLRRALDYENHLVVRVAAQALAHMDFETFGAIEDLERVARSHSDPVAREAARRAIRSAPAA